MSARNALGPEAIGGSVRTVPAAVGPGRPVVPGRDATSAMLELGR